MCITLLVPTLYDAFSSCMASRSFSQAFFPSMNPPATAVGARIWYLKRNLDIWLLWKLQRSKSNKVTFHDLSITTLAITRLSNSQFYILNNNLLHHDGSLACAYPVLSFELAEISLACLYTSAFIKFNELFYSPLSKFIEWYSVGKSLSADTDTFKHPITPQLM